MVVTEALAHGLPVVATEVGGVPEALGHARRRGPAGAARATRRPGRARRRAAGLAGRRRPARAATPGGARTARVAVRMVDHRVRRLWRPDGGGGMTVEQIRVSSQWLDLREPADAAARSRDLVEHVRRQLPAAGRLVIHDLACGSGSMGRWLAPLLPGPQLWVMHDRDAGPAGGRRREPSRAGRRRGPGRRRDAALGHHPAAPGRPRRREPDHRLGAARPDHGRSAGRPGRALLRGWMPGAADAVGRRTRRAGTRRSARSARGGRIRRPPAAHDGGRPAARTGCRCGRRRALPPAGSPMSSSGPAPGGSAPPTPTWRRSGSPDGSMPPASRRQSWPPSVDGYAGRRLAQARAGQLAVTVDHADLLVLP